MDAAFKKVFAGLQTCDLKLAALKHTSSSYRNLAKASGTFGNCVLSWPIELWYETAAEVFHLGEGMGFATLIDYAKSGPFLDVDRVRFEIPVRIRMPGLCFENRSDNVVKYPSEMFLQKSGPSA